MMKLFFPRMHLILILNEKVLTTKVVVKVLVQEEGTVLRNFKQYLV